MPYFNPKIIHQSRHENLLKVIFLKNKYQNNTNLNQKFSCILALGNSNRGFFLMSTLFFTHYNQEM